MGRQILRCAQHYNTLNMNVYLFAMWAVITLQSLKAHAFRRDEVNVWVQICRWMFADVYEYANAYC